MKILIDMNLSPRWAEYFTYLGMEAVHWISIGAAIASDVEIINYARSLSGFALFHKKNAKKHRF